MKGLLRGGANSDDDEEENKNSDNDHNGMRSESPAIIEGVEENDESLNIKINKRKMFTKPPMIP